MYHFNQLFGFDILEKSRKMKFKQALVVGDKLASSLNTPLSDSNAYLSHFNQKVIQVIS